MTALPPPPFAPGQARCRSKAPDGVTRCHLSHPHEGTHVAVWPGLRWRAWTRGPKPAWWQPRTVVQAWSWQVRCLALQAARDMYLSVGRARARKP